MKFNVNNVDKSFKRYLDSYDVNDDKIKLKVIHTYGVVNAAKYLTSKLNLNAEDKNLAILIAYLHDIGRFEQLKRFNTFDVEDKFNHADFGAKILFDENLIDEFVDNVSDEEKEIIRKSIENHNKYKIDDSITLERILLHSKIIRDSDKLDNYRVKNEEDFVTLLDIAYDNVCKEKITDEVYEEFINNVQVRSEIRKTNIDKWLSYLAFTYDLYFKESFEYIKEKDYINKLFDRIDYKDEDTKIKMNELRIHLLEYVNNKINEME